MNCEDFLPAMELGDAREQKEARLHAANCPQCTAAYRALEEVKRALAVHEPLPSEARAVWENALRSPVPESTRRLKWSPALAGMLTAAAACIVVFIFVTSRHTVGPEGAVVVVTAGPRAVVEPDTSAELAQLAQAVETLEGNLVALADHAERLDIEREITLTLNRYSRW